MEIKYTGVPVRSVHALTAQESSKAIGQLVDVDNFFELDSADLSSLATALSAAAERAKLRDSQMSRSDLAALAAKLSERLFGLGYELGKLAHDAEIPATDDPEWLVRAAQATDFINGKANNPFALLSQEQLSLIAYDEGGTFTVNERKAAAMETSRRYCEWSVYICRKMDAERQSNGNSAESLQEILSYYRGLPAIEEAQFGNYEVAIMMQLNATEIDWPEFNVSLVDMVANKWPEQERTAANLELDNEPSSS
ncbi:hypothetical protein [Pseudomonas sp. UBA4617]|uniref:hypothetical protein n=1 Tax=Pseudomonas sp. UBA4617 TaxID=1947318 RepID=UPI0025D73978|nr:hypothetical protein [Pseudomonas sp. UBA4617]